MHQPIWKSVVLLNEQHTFFIYLKHIIDKKIINLIVYIHHNILYTCKL
jgi:hypothetical protein